MKKTIKTGKHRGWPPSFGFYINKKIMTKEVIFHENCKYDLRDLDQYDINKLFGIGYFWSHHKDSARFGWSFDIESKKMMLHAYCYVDGERVVKDLIRVPLEEKIRCSIRVEKGNYVFTVSTKEVNFTDKIPFNHSKTFAYPLGLYFGGNKKAPHKMDITINNV